MTRKVFTDLNLQGNEVLGLPSVPSGGSASTSKTYVDSVAASGLDPKDSCRLATTVDITTGSPIATYNPTGSPPGTGDFTNAPTTIDGVAIVAGNRILVKDQTDAKQNGIYVVNTLTTNWFRAPDQDGTPTNEVSGGNFTFIETGDINAATGWVVQSSGSPADGTLTINVDDINWVQFSGAGGNLNSTYLRLDTTNDPLTNTLEINGTGSPAIALIANGDVQINSQIRGSDQSVSRPTYSFTSEQDSGWYRPDVQTVALSLVGEESIRVVKPGGSPGPSAGSPPLFPTNIGIDFHLKNDAQGNSSIRVETDAPGFDSNVQLITSTSSWNIVHNGTNNDLEFKFDDNLRLSIEDNDANVNVWGLGGSPASAAPELRLYDGTATKYIGLKAPDELPGGSPVNVTYELPESDGTVLPGPFTPGHFGPTPPGTPSPAPASLEVGEGDVVGSDGTGALRFRPIPYDITGGVKGIMPSVGTTSPPTPLFWLPGAVALQSHTQLNLIRPIYLAARSVVTPGFASATDNAIARIGGSIAGGPGVEEGAVFNIWTMPAPSPCTPGGLTMPPTTLAIPPGLGAAATNPIGQIVFGDIKSLTLEPPSICVGPGEGEVGEVIWGFDVFTGSVAVPILPMQIIPNDWIIVVELVFSVGPPAEEVSWTLEAYQV